jgi:hypothetical protein
MFVAIVAPVCCADKQAGAREEVGADHLRSVISRTVERHNMTPSDGRRLVSVPALAGGRREPDF